MADTIDPHYSRALDEIYELRAALAYEARVIEAHLQLATFPKSRRRMAEEQIARMRAACRGEVRASYWSVSPGVRQGLMTAAGASPSLTRGQWEAPTPDAARLAAEQTEETH